MSAGAMSTKKTKIRFSFIFSLSNIMVFDEREISQTNMNILKCICLLLIVSLSAQANEVSEFGIFSSSSPSDSLQTQSKSSVGIGASFGIEFLDKFAVEPGVFYLARSFLLGPSTSSQTEYNLTTIQFPIIFRFWAHRSFSIGAGPYLAHGIQKVRVTPAGQGSNTFAFTDLNWAPDDIGAVGSIKYRAPLNEILNLVIEGRYLYGLKNIDLSEGGNLRFRDLQGLVGISYNL
jgi:hypothetical protein